MISLATIAGPRGPVTLPKRLGRPVKRQRTKAAAAPIRRVTLLALLPRHVALLVTRVLARPPPKVAQGARPPPKVTQGTRPPPKVAQPAHLSSPFRIAPPMPIATTSSPATASRRATRTVV